MDEPRPGVLAKVAVDPFWVLLSMMLGGAWIGWPFWVLNSLALGSSTRKREFILVGVSMLLTGALMFGAVYAINAELIGEAAVPYVLIAFPVVKLTLAMFLYQYQARTAALYEYFGGTLRSGWPVLIVGVVGRGFLYGQSDSLLWVMFLS